jgi:hypothetical protein
MAYALYDCQQQSQAHAIVLNIQLVVLLLASK